MKSLVTIIFVLVSPLAFADYEAEYVVPGPAALVDHSRFKIKIVKGYGGDATQTLAYTFPEELTGNPPLTAVLQRVPGTKNEWVGPEMKASCTTLDNWFSCNVYLVKVAAPAPAPAPASSTQSELFLHNFLTGNVKMPGKNVSKSTLLPMMTVIKKTDVQDFIKGAFKSPELEKKLAVLDNFTDSEPAGILSYEFVEGQYIH